jgi:polysaccharide export outer membrane protein
MVVLCPVIALGGCALVPMSGPTSADVRGGPTHAESLPFAFVKVTPKVGEILAATKPRLHTAFKHKPGPYEIRLGIGDIVGVTVFESGAGGLFIPLEAGVRPGNFVTLPQQAVDNNGNISVPYAGLIRANGRTVVEVQNAIVAALKDRALEPQAIVTLIDQRASSISVLGDAVGSIRFPASASGERILDAITRAGLRAPGSELWVMLERQGRRETVPFGALVYEPANNIYVRPQDTIFIYREPQTFLAFGASGRQGQFPFEAWRISLAEAVAKAGGLNDIQADPASVFIYRGETREVAAQLGIDCTPFPGPIIPVIYNVNLRDPSGYFLATSLEMRNKDVIYISNAVSVDSSKFLDYLQRVMATAQDPVLFATNVYILKNTIKGTANAVAVIGGGT